MVEEVINVLGVDGAAKLKTRSGEHLAVVLAAAFLGVPPSSVDSDGGTDIRFDLDVDMRGHAAELIGRTDVRFVDFEVKSLPGPARAFDARIKRALKRGQELSERDRSRKTQVTSANAIVEAGREMIERAAEQLSKKSSPDCARNVFLISHLLDHMFAEVLDVVIAHHLEPLTDLPGEADAVWFLFAPLHLVVWSRSANRWTNLVFSAGAPGEKPPGFDDGVEILVAVDAEFRRLLGDEQPSPYAFKLTAGDL